MRKILSLALAIVMVLSVTLVAVSAASTATVSLYDISGKLVETKTYNVGETITVTVCLNTSDISTIASLKAEQGYTSSVLTLADAYSETSGLISDLDAMFPVTKQKTVANGKLDGRISYNASTPELDPDGFKFDSDDSVLIVSHYTVAAAGEAAITNTFVTLAEADYMMTRIIDSGEVKNSNFTMKYSLSDPAPVEGGKVSGKVTSYLTDGEVTVQLLQGDTVVKETTVTGKSAEFAFDGVDGGSYTLRFSKANHATRDYDIYVSGNYELNDAKICPMGDVNMSGDVTTMDVTMANSHVQKKNTLTGYSLALADVLPNTAGVTTLDVTRINSHVQKKNPLW